MKKNFNFKTYYLNEAGQIVERPIIKNLKSFIPPYFLIKLQNIKSSYQYRPYKNILKKNKSYKNSSKEKICFIVGSGKSLELENISFLKSEVVFAIHSFCYHKEFTNIMSNKSVDKFFFQAPLHEPYSRTEWTEYLKELESILPKNTKKIFGLNSYKDSIFSILKENSLFKNDEIIWNFTNIINEYDDYSFNKRHLDISANIWKAGTGSILALINALYMGFDKIYLIGLDHDYLLHKYGEARSKDLRENILAKKEAKLLNQDDYVSNQKVMLSTAKIFLQYERINKLFSNKIVNTSQSSLLDVFPKKSLKQIEDEIQNAIS